MKAGLLRYFLSFSIILLSIPLLQAQTLVNTSGNTIQTNNITIEYSIGEIGITTLSANGQHTTQGLLQPIYVFKDCNLLHLIPSAFTPNKDNLNDVFGVKDWPLTTQFEMTIYNRWGEPIFKTTNQAELWNGEYHGILQPMGVYVYAIKATTATCGTITHKGTITLIR